MLWQPFLRIIALSKQNTLTNRREYYDFKQNGIPTQKIEDLINNINSEIEVSLTEAAIEEYVLKPFKDL